MKDTQIDLKENEIVFNATIDYGHVIDKASYDIYPLARFVAEEMDQEILAESGYNEIAEDIRCIQLNLSQLYIDVLELIKEGKINGHAIAHWDNFMYISNQLGFLGRLAGAFQGITVELEKIKSTKVAQPA